MGGQRHAPAALAPGKSQYLLYRRLGDPQGWSGRVRKNLPPRAFDPIASRYTDQSVQAHQHECIQKLVLCAVVFLYKSLMVT